MPGKYHIEEMLREIREDEETDDGRKNVKLSQEEIQKLFSEGRRSKKE